MDTQKLKDGRIIFFSYDDFINEIVKGGNCFICGAQPGTKVFNDEHIIPQWILRKHDLYNKRITLHNGHKIHYSKYTIPCCLECNEALSKQYEVPMSKLFSKTYEEIINELSNSPHLAGTFFLWLCLLYFKAHLKDTTLLKNLDRRSNEGKLSDYFDWSNFHHIHCLIRSHFSGASINPEVFGTIYINRIIDINEGFDYIDNPWSNSMFLQIGDFGVSTVLNDCNMCSFLMKTHFEKINSAVSKLQFLEVFSHLCFLNFHLKDRPIFNSNINKEEGYLISACLPISNTLVNDEEFITHVEDYLYRFTAKTIGNISERDYILENIKKKSWSFLWNDNGEFNSLE